jgi:HK97 family phage major capsid protein
MSSKSRLSPGRRAQLAALGYTPEDVGRIVNTAGGTATLPKDIPVPRNADELAEFFGDPGRYRPIFQDKDTLEKFVAEYGRRQQGDGTDLNRTIAAETQRALIQYLKDNEQTGDVNRLNLDPQTSRPTNMLTSHRQATAYNAKAAGTILDKEFKSASEYFHSAWHLNSNADTRAKMERLRNAYSSVVPADGGFLVPEALRSQLLQIALEQALVRPRATVIPMEAARVSFPMIDSTTNASSVFGGMIAYWAEESATLTASQAQFGRVTLDAKKLTGMAIVPNELLTDSLISFAALIETLWPQALAFYEDIGFSTGTGVGEPLGFIGSANGASVAQDKETGQAADTIVLENIIKMYSRMLPASLNRAVWITTPEALPQLYTLALSVGTGGGPVMLTNVAGPAPMTIFGRPLLVYEKAGRLGDRGDIIFADLSYYLIGDRQVMTAASSTDYRFGNDQTTYRIIQRVDGRPWLQSAITPQNGGPTLSPFVELAARA